MDISYIINQLGEEREEYFNAVSPPIIQTSNFTYPTMKAFRTAFQDERSNHIYTRGNNPTVNILCKKIAALEGAEESLILSSGAAAISNAVVSQVKSGDHIVCVKNCYSWAYNLMTKTLPRFGVSTTFIDGRDINHFKNAIQSNTVLIYLESPSSAVFDLQDLKAVAALAKSQNLITIIDNSYASPLSQSPIKMGVDIVIHSATKYLNGHSDVVAGVIASSSTIINQIFHGEYMTFGNVISPHSAWLMLRGLRTFPIRIQRSSESTQKIVAFLEQHSKVKRVFYPFSPSHPQYELTQQQMSIPMAQFSVEFVTQEISQLDAFCDALQYFLIAVSWGGHESLALPITTDYHGNELNIVRFYIGLEDADILIQDIEQALDVI